MMNTQFFLRLISLGLVLLVGIGRAYLPAHIPDLENVPAFKNKGEARLTVSEGLQTEERGVTTQAALAVTKHLELTASGIYSQLDNCFACRVYVRRHLEIGVGAFDEIENGWVRELHAGAGLGRLKVSNESDKKDPQTEDEFVNQSDYFHYYLQGNLGRNGDWIDVASSLRLALVQNYGYKLFDGNGNRLAAASGSWSLFAEPALTFRFGPKHFRAEGQLGFSLPLSQDPGLGNETVWFSVGLGVSLFGH